MWLGQTEIEVIIPGRSLVIIVEHLKTNMEHREPIVPLSKLEVVLLEIA